jgi:hypothetical protein
VYMYSIAALPLSLKCTVIHAKDDEIETIRFCLF